jgi:hypothetical protein
VWRYQYLTAAQVCRLFYSPGSLSYVQTHLKLLSDAGLLQRLFLPRTHQYGAAPSVHVLARKGRNYLESLGLDIPYRFRPGEQQERAYLFLNHTLALNNILITIELLPRNHPDITVEAMLHDHTLKATPIYVVDSENRRLAVVLDGWVDLRLPNSQRMCLGLEVDMGTIEERRWRRKVRSLVACSQGPYQKRFGTESLTVAVVATTSDKRLADLVRWTELELQELSDTEYAADLFRFAHIPADSTDPGDAFLSPHWYRPFHRLPAPLLEV